VLTESDLVPGAVIVRTPRKDYDYLGLQPRRRPEWFILSVSLVRDPDNEVRYFGLSAHPRRYELSLVSFGDWITTRLIDGVVFYFDDDGRSCSNSTNWVKII